MDRQTETTNIHVGYTNRHTTPHPPHPHPMQQYRKAQTDLPPKKKEKKKDAHTNTHKATDRKTSTYQ